MSDEELISQKVALKCQCVFCLFICLFYICYPYWVHVHAFSILEQTQQLGYFKLK